MIGINLDKLDFKVWADERRIRATNFAEPLKKRVLPKVRREVGGHFMEGGRPTRWPALSPLTRMKELPPGQVRQRILWITGKLRRSAMTELGTHATITSHSLVIEPKGNKWGRLIQTHHSGGRFVGPPIRPRKRRGVLRWLNREGNLVFARSTRMRAFSIPARPILVIRPEMLLRANLELTAWLAGRKLTITGGEE